MSNPSNIITQTLTITQTIHCPVPEPVPVRLTPAPPHTPKPSVWSTRGTGPMSGAARLKPRQENRDQSQSPQQEPDRASSINMEDPEVLCNRAEAYFLEGEYVLAEPLLREALRLSPHHIRALNTLCSVEGALDRLEESLRLCDQILKLSPGHPEASLKKGIILHSQGFREEAIICLKVAAIDPQIHSNSRCILAQVFVANSQPFEAETALQINKNDPCLDRKLLTDSWKVIGCFWRDFNDMERALLAFRSACDASPTDAHVWLELGRLYEVLTEPFLAEYCYETFTKSVRVD